MKKILLPFLLLAATFLSKAAIAQDFPTAVSYMDYIGKQHEDITKKFLSYNSAVSHGKRARKVENLRSKLLDEVQEARENISSMPPYKGDRSYRDSTVSFLKFYFNVLNDDYAKIVNMEDIAEQSYDDMQAYILIKEQVDKKMDEAEDHMQVEEKKFAANNNVNLVDNKSDLDQMMETVAKVNQYYDKIYLVFFKSYKEEEYLLDAIGKKNITAIEQDKSTLLQYAQAGLATLDTTKPFQGDNSLVVNCRSLLKFYIMEVNDKISTVSDYFLKKERFDKMASDYENKSDHSKDDVNNYNKAVNDINAAVNTYNATNDQLNQKRGEALDNWNNAVTTYFSEQTPKYK